MSELASLTLTEAQPAAITPPTTMVLEGDIGRDDLPDIGAMLVRLGERSVRNVVIDFGDVTHFDFRGVPMLVERAEAMRGAGGDLKLAGLSPYLHAIFRSAGGHGAFDYFAQVDEALSAFAEAAAVATH